MEKINRITVICGHYGCGKTNLSINLALARARRLQAAPELPRDVIVLDMDIVNPYFRSSEYGTLLSKQNIRLISPVFANTTLDTPTLPPDMYAAFTNKDAWIYIDAGGDDAGVTALGSLRAQMEAEKYEMIYVINRYRAHSQSAAEAVQLLREIETACGLRATAIVNNSHLGVETTLETIRASIPFAKKTAELCGLPLLYHTVPDFALENGIDVPPDLKVIRRYVKFPWEQENERSQ